MPIYAFVCDIGHVTDCICKPDCSDAPSECGHLFVPVIEGLDVLPRPCAKPLRRKLTAPSAFPGADSWRK